MNMKAIVEKLREIVDATDHPMMIVITDSEVCADIYNDSFAYLPPETQDRTAITMVKRIVDGLVEETDHQPYP